MSYCLCSGLVEVILTYKPSTYTIGNTINDEFRQMNVCIGFAM
jgi:hypothetical protein